MEKEIIIDTEEELIETEDEIIETEEELIETEDELISVDKLISIENKSAEKEISLVEILKIFSPGTAIRSALDDIRGAGMGALIVVNKEGLFQITDGGFKVNCKFSPQKLVELAKMDGAIILSEDMKRILSANVLLTPSMKYGTRETGTRHKAAERTAQQAETIVFAVSERKKKITLYWRDASYVLEEGSEILRKAAETLQILEKQKEIFDEALINLNILEITNLVMKSDVCNILQKIEIIERVSDRVKRYLVELGKEGIIVSMRLKELTKNAVREKEMILKDYFGADAGAIDNVLKSMNFDFLLESSNILRMIFEDTTDAPVSPPGWRILGKTNLLEKDTTLLVGNLNYVWKIFDASRDVLMEIFKNQSLAEHLLETFDELRGKILSGKKL